jgi:hypothetical protein
MAMRTDGDVAPETEEVKDLGGVSDARRRWLSGLGREGFFFQVSKGDDSMSLGELGVRFFMSFTQVLLAVHATNDGVSLFGRLARVTNLNVGRGRGHSLH